MILQCSIRRDTSLFLLIGVCFIVCSSVSSFTVVVPSNVGGGVNTAWGTTKRTASTVGSTPPLLHVSDAEETAPASVEEEADAPSGAPEHEHELTPEEEASRSARGGGSSSTKRKIERERHTLFAGNLPFDASDDEVKALFEQYGTVRLVTVPKNLEAGRPRGFAFIDMDSPEECQACIDALDGTTFGSRVIRVNKSVPKDQIAPRPSPKAPESIPDGLKKLYMGNIPFGATESEIVEFYERFGEVKEVFIPTNPATGEGRGFAFVTMPEEDANRAIAATDGEEFGGRTLVVNEPLPPGEKANRRRPGRTASTKLYVGNLSYYTVPETLEDLFGEFGEVFDCYLPEDPATGGSRGFGFVSMAKQDAELAIKELDQCEVDGRVIRVNEAQPKGARSKQRDSFDDEMNDDEETDVISGAWDGMDI